MVLLWNSYGIECHRCKTILCCQAFHVLRSCTIWLELFQACHNGNSKPSPYQMLQTNPRHSIITILKNVPIIYSSGLISLNTWTTFQCKYMILAVIVTAYIMKWPLHMSGVSNK